MSRKLMTSEERIRSTINLRIPDRIPTDARIQAFACRQKGAPVIGISGGADEKAGTSILKAYHDTYDDLGGYDAQIFAGLSLPASSWRLNIPAFQVILPGTEGIPNHFGIQFKEKENMTLKDYEKITNFGWNGFCEEYFPRVFGIPLEKIDASQKRLLEISKQDARWWKERGVDVTVGASAFSVETILSMDRTFPKFIMDLHRYPEMVLAAMEAMVPDIIQNSINDAEASGIPCVAVGMHRGAGCYFGLDVYERFFFPQLKKMVDAFVEAGLTVALHMDADWTLNLPYLKELPKGKCICELDGTTNIFKAKEILNGHMCIMGDVHATLLTLGKPDEVTAYCTKLIDVIGKGGGFILSTGCECPVDAKFENVKAMFDTAKNYYPHGSAFG